MNSSDRLDLFTRNLRAVMDSPDGMLIFNVVGDEDSYVQFSHTESDRLFCEVSNRSEGWNTHSLDRVQREELTALGFEIPSPHHQANPHKEYDGSVEELAAQVEEIFRIVFRLSEDYAVESSGVFNYSD